jgi:hypothetical protein
MLEQGLACANATSSSRTARSPNSPDRIGHLGDLRWLTRAPARYSPLPRRFPAASAQSPPQHCRSRLRSRSGAPTQRDRTRPTAHAADSDVAVSEAAGRRLRVRSILHTFSSALSRVPAPQSSRRRGSPTSHQSGSSSPCSRSHSRCSAARSQPEPLDPQKLHSFCADRL